MGLRGGGCPRRGPPSLRRLFCKVIYNMKALVFCAFQHVLGGGLQ